MKVVELRFLKGPNLFARRKVLYAVVDLEQLDEVPSSAIAGFTDRLLHMLPGIGEHRCGVGYEGGFVDRLREGTYMGHIAEHLMLELQSLAGDDIRYGNTRMIPGRPRHYRIVAGYEVEAVAERALQHAIDVVEAAADARTLDVAAFVDELKALREEGALSWVAQRVADAARERGIPVLRLHGASDALQLGWGRQGRRLHGLDASPHESPQAVVDRVMPAGDDGRFPLVAITGCDPDTVAQAARTVSAVLGRSDDAGGSGTVGCADDAQPDAFRAASRVLVDPAAHAAVLCISSRDILEQGLAFDRSDVAVVLGIERELVLPGAAAPLEAPARVAGVVTDTARRAVVLDADDPTCHAVLEEDVREGVETLWISTQAGQPHLQRHLAAGGRAVVLHDGAVVLMGGEGGAGGDPLLVGGAGEAGASVGVRALLAAAATGIALALPLPSLKRVLRQLAGQAQTSTDSDSGDSRDSAADVDAPGDAPLQQAGHRPPSQDPVRRGSPRTAP